MLLEIRRTCLYQQCPVCSGKIFRYQLRGTYQSDDYGTTSGIKVRDRCEECREIFGETGITLNADGIEDRLSELFALWESRTLSDQDFVSEIQKLFASEGGWISTPRQNTG